MIWLENPNISIIFSQKSDGDMLFKTPLINADKSPINADTINEKVRANRISFFNKNKINPERLVNIAGVHGTHIAMTRHSDLGKGALDSDTRIPNTDGLIANIKNSYLMITGADCFPVFFYDENKNVVSVAHCGWRGILNGLPAKMISKFISEFGSNPIDIQVFIGPGIKSCHFEVKNDVASLFEKNFKNAIINRDAKIFIDLPEVIMLQLIEAGVGVKSEKITTHPDCTFCEKDKWFSSRRDKSNPIEAAAFIINLKL